MHSERQTATAPTSTEQPVLVERVGECFLCDPEPWRVIFSGKYNRIIAGAGPLCPGYVLLAPCDHHGSAAELPSPVFDEFMCMAALIRVALAHGYSDGHTAYEHGRVGACYIREQRSDWSSHCHHAHRVFVPVATDVLPQLQGEFPITVTLSTPSELRYCLDKRYVFYETSASAWSSPTTCVAMLGASALPSQFMRRALSAALANGRHWDWTADHRLQEMADTTTRLRPFFEGLFLTEEPWTPSAALPPLTRTLTIDGYAYAGKTTVGRVLADCFSRPFIETGLVFRVLAAASLTGVTSVSDETLESAMLARTVPPYLRTPEVSREAARLALDPLARDRYTSVLSHLLARLAPCIVSGRDAWRYRGPEGISIFIAAEQETRILRRFHELFHPAGNPANLDTVRIDILSDDERDASKLPPPDLPRLIRVANDRRPLSNTISETLQGVLQTI